MIDVEAHFLQALRDLQTQFHKNELAYLALTSKPEFAIRDKLAFNLHQSLLARGLIVSREWKRTDLAVLLEARPQALLEIKAMFSFDAVKKGRPSHQYESLLQSDVAKARKVALSQTQIFALLLSTHPAASFDPRLRGVVKYLTKINSNYRGMSASEIRENATSAVRSWPSSRLVRTAGTIAAGEAFGVEVKLDYWLFKFPAA